MKKDDLEKLLASVERAGASTLHLAAGNRPSMRLNGRLVRSEEETISASDLDALSREFLFADHREHLNRGEEVDFLYTTKCGTRFRTVVMRHSKGLGMAFHRIPTTIQNFEELGLPSTLSGICELKSGLVVITGFLGSGKSTTLASLVDYINHNRASNIHLIESPVAFIHPAGSSLIHQREVGFHVQSYASGVREACRTGADVIVVGEVSDSETFDSVLDATEQGVLVFTTIHASSVAAGLAELQSFYEVEDRDRMRSRMSIAVRVMIAQTLLDRAHQRGKVPLLEILMNSSLSTEMISEGDFHHVPATMLPTRSLGSQTSDMALRELLSRNLITEEDALYRAVDREEVLGGRSVLS